jgi:hypothetical protein
MVGQYFKRRREVVEIVVVASSGLGTSLVLAFTNTTLRWRIFLLNSGRNTEFRVKSQQL